MQGHRTIVKLNNGAETFFVKIFYSLKDFNGVLIITKMFALDVVHFMSPI